MLRTDLFKTRNRASTRFIAVRDTRTHANKIASTDAYSLDQQHCLEGRFGIGFHFLVLADGAVQLCRHIDTCGRHSKPIDDVSVSIGVVGGKDEDGQIVDTRTAEQRAAIDDLIGFLSERYPGAEVSDRPVKD